MHFHREVKDIKAIGMNMKGYFVFGKLLCRAKLKTSNIAVCSLHVGSKYIVYYIALYIAIISWMGKLKSYTPVGFAFYDEGCELDLNDGKNFTTMEW